MGSPKEKDLFCLKCPHAVFLDPKKEICWKTGGLFCKKLKAIVGKYDPCRAGKSRKKQAAGVQAVI